MLNVESVLRRRVQAQADASDLMPGCEVDDSFVCLRGISCSFGAIEVLDDIALNIAKGTRVGVLGASGAGKSTLLSIVAGLLEPQSGEVLVGGRADCDGRLARCALMPQRDLLVPWRTALDNACLALENLGVRRSAARAQAAPLFEKFGLAEFEDKHPHQLSGGMRQRVAFLRTLLAGKDVLLLDEPFAALDSITRGQMQEWLLGALEQDPRTVLFVTHDVDEALLLGHHVLTVSARPGRIVDSFDSEFPREGSRREMIGTPEFGALKERALEALEC
jgi:ABC-type nitrate/sulfonate/bicarbonate transport system ATPase subunit